MHNFDGPNIFLSEIVNRAPGKVKLLFLLLQNLIGKHLHFLETIHQEEATAVRKEDDRFAAYPEYIFSSF